MSDGSPKVPAQASPPASATASYARIYEEQQPRLVAYARSLTRNNSWAAEDLVAEAHFRVWRRLSAGHEIENVPAYLMTTVRHLAATAGGETRETPHDPRTAERTELSVHAEDAADPAEQVSSVDLLVRVLGQLPERWVQALWLAEAEGQPLETVGQRIGAKQGATAVLLHRAREGMRQAFLRNQTGAPDDPACEVHWVRMPAYVRGNATPRQSERLLAHVDACDDCRGRLAVLMRANDRLPALVGPALLVFAVGGAGKFLLPFVAGSAGATAALSGQLGGTLHAARQAVTGGTGGAKVPTAIAAGATVAGAALAMMLALGTSNSSPTPLPDRAPLAEAPVVARPPEGPVAVAQAPREAEEPGGPGGSGGSGGSAGVPVTGSDTAVRGVVAEAGPVSAAVPGIAARPAVPAEPAADAPVADEPAPPGAEPVIEPPADDTPPQNDTPPPHEPTPGTEDPAAPEPGAPEPAAPEPAAPGEENPEKPGQETPPYPDVPEPGPQNPQPEAPEAPEVPEPPATPEPPASPEPPEAEVPATPSPSPTPEPSNPTPAEPGPVEETPEAPETPTPPETTAPAPTPQPTPEDPGNPCGN
ncbi:sigma-70 family RNA polymerase sigma factor [Streptomyces cyaneus]|uniref:sigma-70 family RNA polymerase sigma factor n=1 Tax=Streptomyces cyaneus TaxID=1904 RepID=UPI000FF897DB|nr:sigma-70 family RNA polymerase sigma factor [Streptomyces cyaneus]